MKEGTKSIQSWQIDFDWLIELTKSQSMKDGQTKRIRKKNPYEISKKKEKKMKRKVKMIKTNIEN